MKGTSIDLLCINTISFLSIDAVKKANSGHPGMPMGAAPKAGNSLRRILEGGIKRIGLLEATMRVKGLN